MRKRSGFGHVCGFVFSYYLAQTRTLKLTTLPFDSKVNLKLILQCRVECIIIEIPTCAKNVVNAPSEHIYLCIRH